MYAADVRHVLHGKAIFRQAATITRARVIFFNQWFKPPSCFTAIIGN